MEYRKLGETSLSCSVITFGAWAIGGWKWGGSDRNEAVAAIRAAYDAGMTTIDTAPAYGQGLSEEILAEALQDIPRDKIQILDKYGLRWDTRQGQFYFRSQFNDGKEFDMYKLASKESIMLECERSLKRLQTDYIDLYQLHWPDPSTPVAETMEAMIRLKEQGKIRESGVCNYTLPLMQEAEQTLSLVSNQVPYSMILRDIAKEMVPYCLRHRKAIIAYSPLQRGLLTGKIKPGHTFSEGDHRQELSYYFPENIERVNTMLLPLRRLAADKQLSLAQLILRWTVDQPGITIALAGARNAAQAVENAKAADVRLSPEEIAFITQQADTLELQAV